MISLQQPYELDCRGPMAEDRFELRDFLLLHQLPGVSSRGNQNSTHLEGV